MKSDCVNIWTEMEKIIPNFKPKNCQLNWTSIAMAWNEHNGCVHVPYLAPIFYAWFMSCWLKSIDFGEPLISRAFTTAVFSPKSLFFSSLPDVSLKFSTMFVMFGGCCVIVVFRDKDSSHSLVEMIVFIKWKFYSKLG